MCYDSNIYHQSVSKEKISSEAGVSNDSCIFFAIFTAPLVKIKEDCFMKTFCKDYWELYKASIAWLKKHWKGYLVLVAIVTGIELVIYKKDENKCEAIFSKEEEVEDGNYR